MALFVTVSEKDTHTLLIVNKLKQMQNILFLERAVLPMKQNIIK